MEKYKFETFHRAVNRKQPRKPGKGDNLPVWKQSGVSCLGYNHEIFLNLSVSQGIKCTGIIPPKKIHPKGDCGGKKKQLIQKNNKQTRKSVCDKQKNFNMF